MAEPGAETRQGAAAVAGREVVHGAPILAHVVTGPLGAGKTTVLARLLARKPPAENWVVLLNEFTAAGIDALTIAAAARGVYDVRLVEGGCLCCTGEQDFRRNLAELVERVRPQRILIEPSGLGHPAGVVDELLGYESTGRLALRSVVALVDDARLAEARSGAGGLLADQIGIADAVAFSKADAAPAASVERFHDWAAGLYPRKRWAGAIARGDLPVAALDLPDSADPEVGSGPGGRGRRDTVPDASGHAARSVVHGHRVEASSASWRFGREREFSEPRLREILLGGPLVLPDGERLLRLKGVFRVAEDRWLLVQCGSGASAVEVSSWRRDSRAEVVIDGRAPVDAAGWERVWDRCSAFRTAG